MNLSYPSSLKIVPRKRKFESRNRRPPTLVSADAVRALMHLSQREAAEQLDISLTALKSACKKMGITGWPYTRKEKLAAAKEQQAKKESASLVEEEEERESLTRVFRTWRTMEMLEEVIGLIE
ncbi:hypothetical protein GUITHDRAFT_120119 [Guillardia theta CCMP2712]|uniref:RWP-RK domain-containing protein n=1 Tax=Guillardia theta (strain CCMP2712) TaxID=905079 RepID=L1IBN9_GUITC|nr:hypothetical protein GUITHDRAFT_120119 [Guillardia theta CCMP2712]EKX33671.1 hypothetical protein GUITHDRAFT_120119 [Guillardia theta CCMP2712]|eukprot:XP_005820651.1 hypothetical protein GUITHDRAFT_120119 [Guillardia theta CCMP2712]